MATASQYDVFLSYHAPDREAVAYLAHRLIQAGIQPWFDSWELHAGEAWMSRIEHALAQCRAYLIFIGPHGLGNWQHQETQVAIKRSVTDKFPVIPVLLPGAQRQIPAFLDNFSWVEFATTLDDPAAFERLLRGIHRSEVSSHLGIQIPLPSAVPAIAASSQLPAPPRRTGVPAPLTPLIGRDADVDALEMLLCSASTRLVTLNGPGGIGKTRLAIATARRVLPFFRDGVCYVALAAITEPTLVAPAIAQALNVVEQPGVPFAASLAAHLRDQSLLLVLDNFEQVSDAALLVDELLLAAPELHVLVTSREPLHIIGEQRFVVPPLAVPQKQGQSSLTALIENPAIALFVQRVRAVQPQFALTAQNAPVVIDICARLQGLPLAIELVAAQLKGFLGLKDIQAQLDQYMLAAADRARDRPERQQTMRATIAWSYSLLSSNEQTLLCMLAVFAGGCFWDAVKAISVGEDEGEISTTLQSLADKSLVQYSHIDDELVRLTMLELILAFARERLEKRPDVDVLRQWHAEFFQDFAERAALELIGADQKRWMDHLDQDQDNFREAIRWFLAHHEALAALSLTSALWRFWYNRGYLSEGRRYIELALAQVRDQLPQANLSSSQEINTILARALDGLGSLTQKQGDYKAAIRSYQEALVYYRQNEDQQEVAQTLSRLGLALMHTGDNDQARHVLEESLELNKHVGNTLGAARTHNNLGMLAHYQDDYDAAHHHYIQSLVLLRELRDEVNIAIGLGNLGEIAFLQGDFDEAQRNYVQSLMMCHRLDDPEGVAYCLDWLARITVVRVDLLHAARLWGAASALRSSTGISLAPADHAALTESIATARAQSDAALWAVAWAEGQQLSQDQAVTLALNHI